MAISTPCIKICVIDRVTGYCIGCGRTGMEISSWSTLQEPERQATMALLGERMKSMSSRAARGGRTLVRRRGSTGNAR
ncbi:MAG: hypothetical protein RI997_367 [Pseudomonadota bacterium]